MRMWLQLSVVVVVTGAQSEMSCHPLSSRLWVVGTQHKTGTVLLQDVLYEMMVPVKRSRSFQFQDDDYDGIKFWNHADVRPHDVALLVDRARSRDKDLRIVMFERDPREVILSGFFYHQVTDEDWTKQPMANLEFLYETRPHEPRWIPEHLECFSDNTIPKNDPYDPRFNPDCLLQDYVAKNSSYQDMLNDLPDDIGILIESRRSLRDLHAMELSVTTLSTFPDISRIYDLDHVTSDSASFDAAFADMFAFLGVDDLANCRRLAEKHNLHHAIDNHWEEGHAMNSDLIPKRDALRNKLSSFPFYQATINPIRRQLNYFD